MKKEPTTANGLRRTVNAHIKAISKHRDEPRRLIDDAESVEASCDDAIDSLRTAADTPG